MNTAAQAATPTDDDKTIEGGITVVSEQFNALVTIDADAFTTEVFAPFRKELATLKRRAAKEGNYDITTRTGMETAKDLKKQFTKIRTTAENARKERKAPIVEIGKLLDTKYKALESDVREHEDKHAAAIEAEAARLAKIEQERIEAERVRVEQIENRIAAIKNVTAQLAQASSDVVAAKLQELVEKQLDPAMYDDHLEDALRAMNNTIDDLRTLHAIVLEREAAARQAEADRAELKRLQDEAAERQRKEAAEQAERDAQTQRDRAAAAERERAFAEQKAAVERHQAQMNEVMAIQNLAGTTGDWATVDAALQRAVDFQPEDYGSMEPMAKLARNTAIDALNARLATLEKPAAPQPEPVSAAPIPADETGTRSIFRDMDDVEPLLAPSPIEAPLWKTPPTPAEIVDALANHFDVKKTVVVHWLKNLDRDALRLVD